MIGQSIGHYEITAKLGQGGMGEVYRARDTRLNRDVALKILPEMFAQDEQRMGRFSREAQVLASLNHPNIAQIYGLETRDSGTGTVTKCLVMELVEGEDLSERIARGPIPLDEVLPIALQIAEALEAAHNKGIIHRDLKPANIKITPDGKVKILDFGLAKALEDPVSGLQSPASGLSQSPTLTMAATQAGIILGTAAYMSPEQAKGKPVDKRADIWAFGVVLWEMLTGKSLFTGETITDVIAAVVTQGPDLEALPPKTSPAIRRLLHKSLRKDPGDRLPDIGSVRLELSDEMTGASAVFRESSLPDDLVGAKDRRSRIRERRIWVAVTFVLAGLAAIFGLRFFYFGGTSIKAPVGHFTVEPPEDFGFSPVDPLSLSPDGRHIAWTGRTLQGDQMIWVRSLDSTLVRSLENTRGTGGALFWDSESQSIMFGRDGGFRRVDIGTGVVDRIADFNSRETDWNGAEWIEPGEMVISLGWPRATLYRIPKIGGEVQLLASPDEAAGETGLLWPQVLPGTRQILFSSFGQETTGLGVLSLDSPSSRKRLSSDIFRFRYVSPGYIVFNRENVLFAQRFDAEELALLGEPVQLGTGVATDEPVFGSGGWFSVSQSGTLVWLSGRDPELELRWVTRKGQRLESLGKPDEYGQLALSPDGRRLIAEVVTSETGYDLWLFDLARGIPSRLTMDPGNERDPVWSPDSQQVVFTARPSGDENLFLRNLQTQEAASPLPGGVGQTAGARDIAESWHAEGNVLLYVSIGTQRVLWQAALGGDEQPRPLMNDPFAIDEPQISPDGRWLTFISQQSGGYEVYIEPFGRHGERVRVSTEGGGQPRWRGDGRELFYISPTGALMAVRVGETDAGLELGIPEMLVAGKDLGAVFLGPDYDDYAVTPDGERFLFKFPTGGHKNQQIHVLLNWQALLD